MHALGCNHEQKRTDRGEHVIIRWDNMQSDKQGQFSKSKWSYDKSSYDFLGIMHYGAYAFSANGKQTIEPKGGNAISNYLGQREGMSEYDTKQLCEMYECASCHPLVRNKDLTDALISGEHSGSKVKAPTTKNGCECQLDWRQQGSPKCATAKNGGCCNPDKWHGGNWCFTEGQCHGKTWDRCEPADVAPWTKRGCRCLLQWSYEGKHSSKSTGNCMSTDGYEPWCYIETGCIKDSWDSCIPKS